MDKVQLAGELGGMTFGPSFLELSKLSEDIPRTCEKALALDQEKAAQANKALVLMLKYNFFRFKLEQEKQLTGVTGNLESQN